MPEERFALLPQERWELVALWLQNHLISAGQECW